VEAIHGEFGASNRERHHLTAQIVDIAFFGEQPFLAFDTPNGCNVILLAPDEKRAGCTELPVIRWTAANPGRGCGRRAAARPPLSAAVMAAYPG
jgi:hypothetical protein